MKFDNVYFINGTAYAGKSTMLKMLSEKYNGYLCEENYHNLMLQEINSCEFPALTYTRDLKDWRKFIRRTPDEYEAWYNGSVVKTKKLSFYNELTCMFRGRKNPPSGYLSYAAYGRSIAG